MYTSTGDTYPLTAIGGDSVNDIAVVSLDTSLLPSALRANLAPATIGDSDALRAGDLAIAVGTPYDLAYGNSVTVGTISSPKREISMSGSPNTYIQTDAAINPGNSGGGLFNELGQLIGINSNKMMQEDVEGMSFAIPINRALKVVNSLLTKGPSQSLSLGGIESSTFLSEALAEIYQVPCGLVVYRIRSGSSAENAGLHVGDLITHIDGIALTTPEQYSELLLSYQLDDIVTLTVIRDRRANDPITLQVCMESLEKESHSFMDGES